MNNTKKPENPGAFFEKLALEYLQKQGAYLLQSNYRCRYGEIDLIMKHQKTITFVEVRKRDSCCHGSPLETVDYRKQQKIIRSAYTYLKEHRLYETMPCRFDIVGVTLQKEEYHLTWHKNAYSEEG